MEFRDFLMSSFLGRMSYIDFNTVAFDANDLSLSEDEKQRIYESIKFYKYGDDIDNGQAFEGDVYQLYQENMPANEYLVNINAPCDLRKDKLLFLIGQTIEKSKRRKSCYELPLFAGAPLIEFQFDERFRIKKPTDLSSFVYPEDCDDKTYIRLGRLTHPYITAIRSEFAHFIARQGIPRHPESK
jgi:hypothetical protein